MSDDVVSAPAPSTGDRIEWEAQQGKLLIIQPLSLEHDIQTSNGPSDAVRANVHVLTGPETADEHPDILVFPRVLQGQLRGQIGRKVVGRLAKGQAQTGKTAPWVLNEATADDLAKARHYLASRATVPAAPPAASPAPAADPWDTPANAPAADPWATTAQPPF